MIFLYNELLMCLQMNAFTLEKGFSGNPIILSWIGKPPQISQPRNCSKLFSDTSQGKKSFTSQSTDVSSFILLIL